MSYPSFFYNDDDKDTVEETIQDIRAEESPIDNIFDMLAEMFYTIFPGLKTREIQDELAMREIAEDGELPVSTLNATEAKKAITKAEKAEAEGGDLFDTLSKELSDEEEVEKKLKALLDK
jgi:hypothetical protein